ncbi:MAG: MSMEG_1061 family FMN-dependent PPOX-type flavoprotein [Acidimicrobiales bacterium]
MQTDANYQLTTHDQVAGVLGTPPDFIVAKLGDHVDEPARQFIALAPLVFLATHDSEGHADVSPKGDAPGFVQVIDSTTLLIPERKGNNLADGVRNIIDTGRVGMIFVVPGQRETLRVNGTATVNNDPALLDRLAAHDKPSLLCTVVSVEECFFHCGKSLIRSNIWKPDTWSTSTESLMVKQTVTAMGGDPDLKPVIAATIEQNYIDDLY